MLNRRLALAAFACTMIAGGALAAASVKNPPIPKISPAIQKAVADPSRPKAQVERDPARKPAETLALLGMKPGDKVLEIASFGQYYTDIVSSLVGPKGHVWMYDLPYTQARSGEATAKWVAAHPNAEFKSVKYDEYDAYPKNLDSVLIVLYYHDLGLNQIDIPTFNRKMYAALKPGGKLLVVDHEAAPGSGRRDAGTLHRMETKLIVDELTAAGFRLIADSDMLRNPQDDKSKRVFDPGLRGHTDQAVYIFQKPR